MNLLRLDEIGALEVPVDVLAGQVLGHRAAALVRDVGVLEAELVLQHGRHQRILLAGTRAAIVC